MRTFEYRGYDSTGKGCRGLVEAVTLKEAREKLAARGVLAERITSTGRKARFSMGERASLYAELSALLSAGLPLVKALETMMDAAGAGGRGSMIAGVRDRVREGMSLAQSFAEASASVTAHEAAVIEAAEETGTLDMMLDRLGAFLEEQEKLKDRIQGALYYPVIVFCVGICVAVLMLGLLVPRARDILGGSEADLPALTEFMIGFGRIAGWLAVPAIVALTGLVLWFRRRLRDDENIRVRWSRSLLRIPLFGGAYRRLVVLRFSRTLGVLLKGGVAVMDGLRLAGRATGSAWIAGMADTEAESIRHGSRLSDAVRRMPPLADSLPGWIQIGEAGGGIDKLLDKASVRYQNDWDRYITRALALFEPALILVIGGFVLLVTLSVLLPIFSLTSGAGTVQ